MKITVAQALRRGIGALNRNKRLLFVFYAVTTAWSLLLAAVLMAIALDSLDESAWAAELARNLSPQWPAELFAKHGAAAFAPAFHAVLAVFAISIIPYLFLLGGAIHVFCHREPSSLQAFFAGCGRNFGRMVRVTLVSVVFYAIVIAIGAGLSAIGGQVWGEGSEATPIVYWGWFQIAVVACLFGYVNLVFDYARIRLVAGESRKAWRAALGSFRFVWRNLGRTVGLYAVVWIIALLILAAYFAISRVIAQTSVALALLLLLVRQIVVIAKIWSRLLFYSAQWEMYESLAPVMPAPVIMPEPVVMLEPEPEPQPEPEPEPTLEPEPGFEPPAAPEPETP